MKKSVILFSLVLLFGCNKKPDSSKCESESKAKSDKKFDMYQLSEMAALMESMYLENKQLKERIKKGDTIGKFPSHFLQSHF